MTKCVEPLTPTVCYKKLNYLRTRSVHADDLSFSDLPYGIYNTDSLLGRDYTVDS